MIVFIYINFFFFDPYLPLEKLPKNVEEKYSQNRQKDYYFHLRDSLKISRHDEIKGRYYKKKDLRTKIYWNIPIVLSLDTEYLVIGSDNSTLDDGLDFFLPIKYTNIDIYSIDSFKKEISFCVNRYIKFAFFDKKNLYLIFNIDEYGIIKI
jgi:hypothetical protein